MPPGDPPQALEIRGHGQNDGNEMTHSREAQAVAGNGSSPLTDQAGEQKGEERAPMKPGDRPLVVSDVPGIAAPLLPGVLGQVARRHPTRMPPIPQVRPC